MMWKTPKKCSMLKSEEQKVFCSFSGVQRLIILRHFWNLPRGGQGRGSNISGRVGLVRTPPDHLPQYLSLPSIPAPLPGGGVVQPASWKKKKAPLLGWGSKGWGTHLLCRLTLQVLLIHCTVEGSDFPMEKGASQAIGGEWCPAKPQLLSKEGELWARDDTKKKVTKC